MGVLKQIAKISFVMSVRTSVLQLPLTGGFPQYFLLTLPPHCLLR